MFSAARIKKDLCTCGVDEIMSSGFAAAARTFSCLENIHVRTNFRIVHPENYSAAGVRSGVIWPETGLEKFKWFREECLAADPEDDKLFGKLVRRGFELELITVKTIAQKFGISLPSAERWRTARGAPHPVMRRPIYKWMADETFAYIEAIRRFRTSDVPTKKGPEKE
jgi:hypothetical protein